MGNPISKAIKEQQNKNDEEAVEAFQLMHKRMQSKIDSASAKVINLIISKFKERRTLFWFSLYASYSLNRVHVDCF